MLLKHSKGELCAARKASAFIWFISISRQHGGGHVIGLMTMVGEERSYQLHVVEYPIKKSNRNVTPEHETKPEPTLFIPLPMVTLKQPAMSELGYDVWTWALSPKPEVWLQLQTQLTVDDLRLSRSVCLLLQHVEVPPPPERQTEMLLFGSNHSHAVPSSGLFWRETTAAAGPSGKWHHCVCPHVSQL